MLRTATLALLTTLVAALLVATGSGAAQARSYGHTGAPDRVLRDGCHRYRYHYVIKPPNNDWVLETYLRDPRHRRLASNAFSSDSERKRGHGRFQFCRYSAVPGRFTIRAKLTWYTTPILGAQKSHQVWLDPSHFRLRRP